MPKSAVSCAGSRPRRRSCSCVFSASASPMAEHSSGRPAGSDGTVGAGAERPNARARFALSDRRAGADPDSHPPTTAGADRHARARVQFRAALDWTATRAFALPWAYEGYLRLNQRGREPAWPRRCRRRTRRAADTNRNTLSDLRVAGHRRARRGQDGAHAGGVPRTRDQRTARPHGPLAKRSTHRRGRVADLRADRQPRSRTAIGALVSHPAAMFAFGGGIRPGAPIADVRDVDIAPTVLALLGVVRHPTGSTAGRFRS